MVSICLLLKFTTILCCPKPHLLAVFHSSGLLQWCSEYSLAPQPYEHVAAGEIGNGHDGLELPVMTKTKPKAAPGSAALGSKLDKSTIKEANKVNKAAWI